MKYLATMEMREERIPSDPQGLVQHLGMVVKQHEIEAKLEKEKKILAGGGSAGKMMDALIVDVETNKELNDLIRDLPLSPVMKVDIIPLVDFEDCAAKERQGLERLKEALV